MQVIIDYFECEITIYFQEATTCIVIVSLILIFIYDSQVKILLYQFNMILFQIIQEKLAWQIAQIFMTLLCSIYLLYVFKEMKEIQKFNKCYTCTCNIIHIESFDLSFWYVSLFLFLSVYLSFSLSLFSLSVPVNVYLFPL